MPLKTYANVSWRLDQDDMDRWDTIEKEFVKEYAREPESQSELVRYAFDLAIKYTQNHKK